MRPARIQKPREGWRAREITLDPVHANAGVEAWYRAKLRALILEMHRSVLLHVRAAYKRDEPGIGFAQDAQRVPDPWIAQDDSSAVVGLRRALAKWGRRWTRRLDSMAAEIAKQFARRNGEVTQRAIMAAFQRAGFVVEFRPTKASVEAYRAVLAENVNLIKSIPAQYLKDVESEVWQSVMKGGRLSDLTAGIHAKYGVAYRRAAFIARDQNNKARAIMENVRRQELGITEAVWQHSHAGREPRPTHVAMNGKRFKLKEGMYDSAIGKNVWPGTEPNCRCTSRAVIPGITQNLHANGPTNTLATHRSAETIRRNSA